MTGEETYDPDWSGWLLITEVTVEDAVALTLNVDPDRRFDWEKRASMAERAEFERRVFWLKKWPLRPLGFFSQPSVDCVDAGGFGPLVLAEIRKFYLPEVLHFAKKGGWELPAPLLRLIEVQTGDRTKAPIEASVEDEPARRRQVPNRPFSETAWRRYNKACELYPDFYSSRGGISKAARGIAKNEKGVFASVRRDLHRVLKAQGDPTRPKNKGNAQLGKLRNSFKQLKIRDYP
jgi:hypothetical protein